MARQRAAVARCISPRHRLASGRASRLGMKVAIRDDDTSYFTTPEALEHVYGDVWDRVPVCLAVVPFAIGYEQAGIPAAHWHSGESFALDRNPALVDFLRRLIRARRVTIAL